MKVTLTITPARGNWQAPPEKRLAMLLKTMLRAFGWRCLSAKPDVSAKPDDNGPHRAQAGLSKADTLPGH